MEVMSDRAMCALRFFLLEEDKRRVVAEVAPTKVPRREFSALSARAVSVVSTMDCCTSTLFITSETVIPFRLCMRKKQKIVRAKRHESSVP